MEEKKLYIKIGTFEEKDENNIVINKIQNCILGYFICYSKTPKYKALGCNFDESKDFENAINIKTKYLEHIKINKSQYINGEFIEN